MANEYQIITRQLQQAVKRLKAVSKAEADMLPRAHYRMGALVKDVAQLYAPRSPTQGQLNKDKYGKSYKGRKRSRTTGRFMRKARGTSRPKPGMLERSITFTSNSREANIFVPVNSEAGMYAFYIHEEKNEKWFKRGLGTRAKGSQADEKFIFRAIRDNHDDLLKILRDENSKALAAAMRSGTGSSGSAPTAGGALKMAKKGARI